MMSVPLQAGQQEAWAGLRALGSMAEFVGSVFSMDTLGWLMTIGTIYVFVTLLTARRWTTSAMTTAAMAAITRRTGRRLWSHHPALAVAGAVTVPWVVYTLAGTLNLQIAQWLMKWGTLLLIIQYLWRAAVYKALGEERPPLVEGGIAR